MRAAVTATRADLARLADQRPLMISRDLGQQAFIRSVITPKHLADSLLGINRAFSAVV
jgi:hypothetical protein